MYEAHLKNAFVKKEKNAVKSQKLLAENLHKRPPIQNIQKLFIHFQLQVKCNCHTSFCLWQTLLPASIFCDFWKWPFLISLHLSQFWLKQTFVFLDVLYKEFWSLSVSKYD